MVLPQHNVMITARGILNSPRSLALLHHQSLLMSKGVIAFIQYRLGQAGNLHAALVKVSVTMVFYILVHHPSTYSVLQRSALPQVLQCVNVTCRLNLLCSALLYSITQDYCVLFNHQVPSNVQCVWVCVV